MYRPMKPSAEPTVRHTLPKEPHVTIFARANVNTSLPTSLASSSKFGVFVGDTGLHAVFRLQYGNASALIPPTENPVAGDFNELTPTAMAYHHIRESLVVADALHHVVREICVSEDHTTVAYGAMWTLAGSSGPGKSKAGYKEGPLLKSKFSSPSGICVTLWGDILVSDTNNDVIRMIREDNVTTLAGNGSKGFRDGPRHSARFNAPMGIVSDAQGDVFVCDSGNRRIRMIDETGEVTTVAGNGEEGLDDGPHLGASFYQPERLCLTERGDIIVVGHHIRVIQSDGNVSTLAECVEEITQRKTELRSFLTKKRPLSRRVLDFLTLKSMTGETPSRVVVPSRRSKESKFKLKFDPSYHIHNGTSAQEFVDPHERLSWIGDAIITPDGNLLLANPTQHCIKQIQGILSLLYPLKDDLAHEPSIGDQKEEILEPKEVSPNGFNKHRLEANCSLTALIDSYNPFFDYELTISTRGGETTTWLLHALVLFISCPSLLIETTLQQLRALGTSVSTIETLLRYIYGGTLPTGHKPPIFWAELFLVARTVRLHSLAQYCCYETYKSLQFEDSIDLALALLKDLPTATQIFDAVSEFISTQREFSATTTTVIKRRLSLSDALAKMDPTRGTKLKYPPAPPPSLSSSLSALPTHSEIDNYNGEKANVMPALHASGSDPLLLGCSLTDPGTIANRVMSHSRYLNSSDRKLHERNKVNPFGFLQEQLPLLGPLLKNPPPKKDSLVPYPELLAPDFYLKVEGQYIPCHGCILYARWPWFKTQIDRMDAMRKAQKLTKPIFAPYAPGHSPPSSAIYTPARRVTTSFVSNKGTILLTRSRSDPLASNPSTQPRLSVLESISLCLSKTFRKDRCIEIPPNTLRAGCVHGLIWYLYSGDISQIPSYCVDVTMVSCALQFGFVDSLGNPQPPFEGLTHFIRALLNKPITLENVFTVFHSSHSRGHTQQADRAREFMSNHIGAIFENPGLSHEFDKLSEEDRRAILRNVPVSAPSPQLEEEYSTALITPTQSRSSGPQTPALYPSTPGYPTHAPHRHIAHRTNTPLSPPPAAATQRQPSSPTISSSSWAQSGPLLQGNTFPFVTAGSSQQYGHRQLQTLASYRQHYSEEDDDYDDFEDDDDDISDAENYSSGSDSGDSEDDGCQSKDDGEFDDPHATDRLESPSAVSSSSSD